MDRTDTVVLGAGHAGLATSRALTAAGREHVVLDRAGVGSAWARRWDSLTLLTPTWLNRLPGWEPPGDPDGFLTAAAFAQGLEAYAASFDAPVVTGADVLAVDAADPAPGVRFRVTTTAGTWLARDVVLATGAGTAVTAPPGLGDLPPDVDVVPSTAYRSPAGLRPGAVLVVGASSSGVQIADELARAGRRVLLAVGRHTRAPRRYRGMDLFWWLHRTGRLDRAVEDVPDARAARREPSFQLLGASPARAVDLPALHARGVELLGRWRGADDGAVHLAPDLPSTTADAERRLARVLAAIDAHIAGTGLEREVLLPDRPDPFQARPGRTSVRLRAEGVSTVLLATGLRAPLPWLHLPVVDADGAVRERRGVTDVPGLYVVGARFQTRRASGLVAGAGADAAEVVAHLLGATVPLTDAPARPAGGAR